MIQEAADFAAKAHEGVFRKGSHTPYIVHPKEVAAIVAVMTKDPEVIAAAYLHDVIEDAGVRYEELAEIFGKRVADLVRTESEDKSRTWLERKRHTIDYLRTAPYDERLIAFGDKLSNLRSVAMDYLACGDAIWEKFNQKDKRMHEWYYRGVYESFGHFREYPFYMEYRMLLEFIFGEKDRSKPDKK